MENEKLVQVANTEILEIAGIREELMEDEANICTERGKANLK